MKIEVKPTEGQKDILTIFIDQEPWKKIHTAVFGRFPSVPPAPNKQEWVTIFREWEYKRIKYYVLRRLTSQSYHSEQLAKLLKERLISSQIIKKIIQECQEWGYLNDQIWVESFIRCQHKRQGLKGVIAKLQAKGLSIESLQQVRDKWIDPEQEKQTILNFIQKRHRSKDLTQFKEKQKVFAGLIRKGYDFELIKQVFANLSYS